MEGPEVARLQTFQHHIEDMRNLTLCKICLKPFYEPFILACGHTYCYECLNSWFGGTNDRRKRKNCPDCRADVVTQPAPNYLLRELVHLFITRSELLPEDETIEEHRAGREASAARVAGDRTGRGLFAGAFDPRGGHSFGRAIVDHEDHVLRCPNCAYELEDGACEQCGWGTPTHPYFSDFTEDDLSGLDDDASMISVVGGDPRILPHTFYGIGSDGDDDDDDLGSIDSRGRYREPNEYDDNDDFIDNGDYPNEIDDDDDDEDEDDIGGFSDISTAPSVVRRGGRFTDTVRSGFPPPRTQTATNAAPDSRSHFSTDTPQSDEWTDYADSEVEYTSDGAPQTPVRRGRQAIVISDDDDDDEEEEEMAATEEEEDEDDNSTSNVSLMTSSTAEESGEEQNSVSTSDSEDSDDTILPAQTRSRRQQRLNNHRNRRSTNLSNQAAMSSSMPRSFNDQQRNSGRAAQTNRPDSRRGRMVGYAF